VLTPSSHNKGELFDHTLSNNLLYFTVHVRDHFISSHAISRRNYFRAVGAWSRAPLVFKIVQLFRVPDNFSVFWFYFYSCRALSKRFEGTAFWTWM